MTRARRIPAALLTALLLVALAAGAESPFDGHWQGAIDLPTGKLELDVDLASDADGTLSGDISIPVQSIKDMALGSFVVDGRKVTFQIPGIPGDPTFEGTLSEDGSTLAGPFRQGGGELTFSLARGDDPATAARAALEGFDAVAEKAVADFNVPGLGLAVVAGGEVVYSKGFGFRDLEQGLPMTADSLFAIGSTTKAMTATVLGMLVDQGKLDWDEPLVRYLPTFRLADPAITSRVSARDLVTHRTGLPRHDLLWYNNNEGTRGEMIARFAHLELTADLRERWQYNNLMFMTAGYLAGQLDGGVSWEETMRRRLFLPLGMTRSVFSTDDAEQDPDHALPYRENDDDALERIPFRRITLVGPAGSVMSSIGEMAQWLRFNLASGTAPGGEQLIQPSTLADIQAPHMTMPPAPAEARVAQSAYGMGWGVEVYRGHKRVQHGGGIDGFITAVMLYPDDDLGLVAFTNRGSGLPSLIAATAADRILGLEPVDWLGEALKRAEAGEAAAEEAETKKDAIRVAGTAPSHPLDDHAGSYGHPGYGTARIEVQGETLAFTFNGITAPLEHWHYDVWNGAETEGDPTFESMRFQFRTDFDGQVAELVVPLEITARPIVFTKQPDPRLADPAHLAGYTGTFQGETGQRGRIELSGTRLTLHLPGQPTYTLVPQVSGRFGIDGLARFSVGFELDDAGKATKVVFYQPNGVFESVRVEE